MFHVPVFIDARLQVRGSRKISEVQVRVIIGRGCLLKVQVKFVLADAVF